MKINIFLPFFYLSCRTKLTLSIIKLKNLSLLSLSMIFVKKNNLFGDPVFRKFVKTIKRKDIVKTI